MPDGIPNPMTDWSKPIPFNPGDSVVDKLLPPASDIPADFRGLHPTFRLWITYAMLWTTIGPGVPIKSLQMAPGCDYVQAVAQLDAIATCTTLSHAVRSRAIAFLMSQFFVQFAFDVDAVSERVMDRAKDAKFNP